MLNNLANLTDEQFKELIQQIVNSIKPKPLDCHDHIMNKEKCKYCMYNIGICYDMYKDRN